MAAEVQPKIRDRCLTRLIRLQRVASDKASDPNSFLEQELCQSKLLDRFRYFKQKGETFADVTDR